MKQESLFIQLMKAGLNANLNKNEAKVYMALVMQTIGYGKLHDFMTDNRLVNLTHIRKARMKAALKSVVVDKGLFDAVEAMEFDNCYSIPDHYHQDFFTPHVPKFGERFREKEIAAGKREEFPKNGIPNTDLILQSLSLQPQPQQTPEGRGGERENQTPTPPQPSLIGKSYHPYCPYEDLAYLSQTKTVAYEKRCEGVVLAVKFDDNSVAKVIKGEVIGFIAATSQTQRNYAQAPQTQAPQTLENQVQALQTQAPPTPENHVQALQTQAPPTPENHVPAPQTQVPQTQAPPLPEAISAANQSACRKALRGLSEAQCKAVIDTFLDKQKTSTIRKPAGLFITLARCAKQGTLIVAEAFRKPSSPPPSTHPSHRQAFEEDDQEEKDRQACRWLYDRAKHKTQSSMEALAKEAKMESLLKTAAYFGLLKWMNSSKKRELIDRNTMTYA